MPFFDQVLALNQSKPEFFGGQAFAQALVRTLESAGCVVVARGEPGRQAYDLSVTNKVARVTTTLQQTSADVSAQSLTNLAKGLAEDWSEGYFSGQADILPLIKLVQARDARTAATLFEAVRLGLRSREIEDMDDAEFARDFMATYYDDLTDEDREIVGQFAEQFANSEIENLIGLKDPGEIRDRFKDLMSLADDFGNFISHADASRIENRIEYLEYTNDNYEDWDGNRGGDYQRPAETNEDAAIDDLFDSMERD